MIHRLISELRIRKKAEICCADLYYKNFIANYPNTYYHCFCFSLDHFFLSFYAFSRYIEYSGIYYNNEDNIVRN